MKRQCPKRQLDARRTDARLNDEKDVWTWSKAEGDRRRNSTLACYEEPNLNNDVIRGASPA
jgi:hypothetical protein